MRPTGTSPSGHKLTQGMALCMACREAGETFKGHSQVGRWTRRGWRLPFTSRQDLRGGHTRKLQWTLNFCISRKTSSPHVPLTHTDVLPVNHHTLTQSFTRLGQCCHIGPRPSLHFLIVTGTLRRWWGSSVSGFALTCIFTFPLNLWNMYIYIIYKRPKIIGSGYNLYVFC